MRARVPLLLLLAFALAVAGAAALDARSAASRRVARALGLARVEQRDTFSLPTREDLSRLIDQAREQIRAISASNPSYTHNVDPAPQPFGPLRHCSIPQATAMLARPYRTVNLNTQINAGYSELAKCFQSIATGNPAAESGLGSALPVWYAIAPFASRVVGKGEIALGGVVQAVGTVVATLRSFATRAAGLASLGVVDAAREMARLATDLYHYIADGRFSDDLLKVAVFMITVMDAGANAGANRAALNLDVLRQVFAKLKEAVTPPSCAPDFSCCPTLSDVTSPTTLPGKVTACVGALTTAAENMIKVPQTLLNALEEGNRRIYTDIGVTGERYLNWRKTALNSRPSIPAAEVMTGFCAQVTSNAGLCNQVWTGVQTQLAQARTGTVASEFQNYRNLDARMGHMAVKSAAFALIEHAGAVAADRAAAIKLANNLLAWVEQSDAVVHAFLPGSVQPGELNRVPLFTMMTPFIHLVFNTGAWTYWGHAGPACLGRNWGEFRTRWEPILASFTWGYGQPSSAIWPLPRPFALDGNP